MLARIQPKNRQKHSLTTMYVDYPKSMLKKGRKHKNYLYTQSNYYAFLVMSSNYCC